MRRERKTTRSRQEVRDGQEVTVRVHTYHCGQCSRFLYSNEQVHEPVPAGSDPADSDAAPAPETATDTENPEPKAGAA
jgi:hypothetical protein